MGLADLLQAPERKMKIEPKSDTHYTKEGGLSSIFALGLLICHSIPVHGFDQRPVLLIDGFAFRLHRRSDIAIFRNDYACFGHGLTDRAELEAVSVGHVRDPRGLHHAVSLPDGNPDALEIFQNVVGNRGGAWISGTVDEKIKVADNLQDRQAETEGLEMLM